MAGNKARGTTEGFDPSPTTVPEDLIEQNDADRDSIEDTEQQGDRQNGDSVDAGASDETDTPLKSPTKGRREFIEGRMIDTEVQGDESGKVTEVIEIGFDSAATGGVVKNADNTDFMASDAFVGPRMGYYYGSGSKGLGYYSDPQRTRAQEETMGHTASYEMSLSTANSIEMVEREKSENEVEVDPKVAATLAETLPEICLLCEESMASSATLTVMRERQTWLNVMLSIELQAAKADEHFVKAYVKELRPRWVRLELDTDSRYRHRETFYFHGSVDVKQGAYTELSHDGKELILVLAKAQKGEDWNGGITSRADSLSQEEPHSVVVEPGFAKNGEDETKNSAPGIPNHTERDEAEQANANELDVEPEDHKVPEESNPAAALLGQSLRLRSTLHWVLL